MIDWMNERLNDSEVIICSDQHVKTNNHGANLHILEIETIVYINWIHRTIQARMELVTLLYGPLIHSQNLAFSVKLPTSTKALPLFLYIVTDSLYTPSSSNLIVKKVQRFSPSDAVAEWL